MTAFFLLRVFNGLNNIYILMEVVHAVCKFCVAEDKTAPQERKEGESMKVIIEGTEKEIAALVLELQERQGNADGLLNGAKFNADNLIGEENNIAEITRIAVGGQQAGVR